MSKKKKKSISIKTIIFLRQTSSLNKKRNCRSKKTGSNLWKTQDQTKHCGTDHKNVSLTITGIKPKTKTICFPISHQLFSSAQLFTSDFLMFNLEHLKTSFPALAVLFALKRYE